MSADPPVRADGRCAQCGKQRNLTVKKSATNRLAAELLPLDPFCSTECCRAFHGCESPKRGATGWDTDEERMREATAGYRAAGKRRSLIGQAGR